MPVVLIVLLSVIGTTTYGAVLADGYPLPTVAKFSPVDDPSHAQPTIDDSQWSSIQLPASWRQQGVAEQTEIGWYRLTFTLDQPLPWMQPALALGWVMFSDQVYLNGQLIGGQGYFSTSGSSFRSSPPLQPRLYPFDPKLLNPHGDNLLAIRIGRLAYLQDGGIIAGPVALVDYVQALPEFVQQQHPLLNLDDFFLGMDTLILCSLLAACAFGLRDRATLSLTLTYLLYYLQELELRPLFYHLGGASPWFEWLAYKAVGLALIPLLEFVNHLLGQTPSRHLRGLQVVILLSAFSSPLYTSSWGHSWYLFSIQLWLAGACWSLGLLLFWSLRGCWRQQPYAPALLLGISAMALGVLADWWLPVGWGQTWLGMELGSLSVRLFLLSLAVMFALRFVTLERALQQAQQSMLTAQQQERRRLARDIHDGVGQWLSALKLHLQQLHAKTQHHTTATALQQLVQDSQQAIEDTRRIAHDLSPVLLQQQGLVAALQQLSRQLGPDRLTVIAPSALTLSDSRAEHLYRLVQEAINNALRHGQATQVLVQLQAQGHQLHLSIQDNGQGLSEQSTPGQGWQGMQERALLLGGQLSIQPNRPCGVRVSVTLDLGADSC